MRTMTTQSSKATSRLRKLFAAMLLVWLLIPVGQVSAQTSGTLKAYWKFSRPDGTHGQLNLFCAASSTEGREITDWDNPGWQDKGLADVTKTSNPQLSPSMSFLRVHVLSLLNYHIN